MHAERSAPAAAALSVSIWSFVRCPPARRASRLVSLHLVWSVAVGWPATGSWPRAAKSETRRVHGSVSGWDGLPIDRGQRDRRGADGRQMLIRGSAGGRLGDLSNRRGAGSRADVGIFLVLMLCINGQAHVHGKNISFAHMLVRFLRAMNPKILGCASGS